MHDDAIDFTTYLERLRERLFADSDPEVPEVPPGQTASSERLSASERDAAERKERLLADLPELYLADARQRRSVDGPGDALIRTLKAQPTGSSVAVIAPKGVGSSTALVRIAKRAIDVGRSARYITCADLRIGHSGEIQGWPDHVQETRVLAIDDLQLAAGPGYAAADRLRAVYCLVDRRHRAGLQTVAVVSVGRQGRSRTRQEQALVTQLEDILARFVVVEA